MILRKGTKKKEKKKACIYIYAYQLLVGYSKSSKTLLQAGINTSCKAPLFKMQKQRKWDVGISKSEDYQTSFEIGRKLVKGLTGNAMMKEKAEAKSLKTFPQNQSN